MEYLCFAVLALIAVSAVNSNLELENQVSTDVPMELDSLTARTFNKLPTDNIPDSLVNVKIIWPGVEILSEDVFTCIDRHPIPEMSFRKYLFRRNLKT
jgi:hypothetical protein